MPDPDPSTPAVPDDLAEPARFLEQASATQVIAWAAGRFGEGLVLASSFEDCVLIDIAEGVAPGLEVVFLDTGFHFPETLAYVETVRRRYGLNLSVMHPEVGEGTWPCGTERCCEVRKVEPLARALSGRRAWLSGLLREDTAIRASAPVVSWDAARGVVKVNPLATWTRGDLAAYAAARDLPPHPLAERGYVSIGCAPTTTPVGEGEDPRAGRWRGSAKTECGLHLDLPSGEAAGEAR